MKINFIPSFFLANSIIYLILIMLIISSTLFFFNITISFLHLPITLGFTSLINFLIINNYEIREPLKVFIKNTLFLLAILIASFIIANSFYDYTVDGQSYHMDAVILLKEGWNPFKSSIEENYPNSLWINHYTKGSEVSQAVVYAFTNQVETGKATNILLVIASFFLCISLFKQFHLSDYKVYLISILLALNPVVVNQVLSTYVDGEMTSLLLCLIVISCLLYNNFNLVYLFLFAGIVVLIINVKFTSIAFTGIIVSGFLLVLIFQKRIKEFKKVFLIAAGGTIISILLVGYNPYITNTINYGHPLYPLAGKDKADIFTSNFPLDFQNKNRFEKLAISVFSKTENPVDDTPTLKFPFLTSKEEVFNLSKVANRTGGFGIWFSGILLFSSILLFLLIKYKNEHLKYFFILVSILIISIFIIPEPWWARYIPQLYFIPIIILIFAELYHQRFVIYLKNFIYLILLINLGLIGLMTIRKNILIKIAIDNQLDQLKKVKQPLLVDYDIFRSNRIRFSENGIQTSETDLSKEGNLVDIEYSYTKVKQVNNTDDKKYTDL